MFINYNIIKYFNTKLIYLIKLYNIKTIIPIHFY